MQVSLFMVNKIKRQIAINGNDFTFSHEEVDKYHNKTGVTKLTALKGVFHQSTSYMQKSSDDGSVTTQKPSPMILCLYEDAKNISKNDELSYNGHNLFVTGIEDVLDLNQIAQISLEEIKNG